MKRVDVLGMILVINAIKKEEQEKKGPPTREDCEHYQRDCCGMDWSRPSRSKIGGVHYCDIDRDNNCAYVLEKGEQEKASWDTHTTTDGAKKVLRSMAEQEQPKATVRTCCNCSIPCAEADDRVGMAVDCDKWRPWPKKSVSVTYDPTEMGEKAESAEKQADYTTEGAYSDGRGDGCGGRGMSEYELIELYYPRNDNAEKMGFEISLMDCRAADNIRVDYDFERDGWRIQQASMFSWLVGEEQDEDWQEVAFIKAWDREKPGQPHMVFIEEGEEG